MFLLDRSRTTIDDLRKVSQASREAKLDQELARFEENLELALVDKTKFLEALYRRLQQATSRWKSWHRRKAGGGRGTQFISRQQIEELVHWERSMKCKKKYSSRDEDQHVDMLIRFILACQESQDLFDQFNNKIFCPLDEFFSDDQAEPLVKALSDVLHRWKGLLSPGPINHRLFSPKSADAVYYMDLNSRPRDSQFNLVLRLVPDLALKAFEALCLAKQWRGGVGLAGYTRELNYIYNKWIPEKREEDSRGNSITPPGTSSTHAQQNEFALMSNYDRLRMVQGKLSTSKTQMIRSSVKMDAFSRETDRLTGEFGNIRDQVGHMKNDVKVASAARGKVVRGISRTKEYIDMLHVEMGREQQEIQRIRARLLQAEMSWKYTTNREMNKMLEEDLAESVARCQHLRTEINRAEAEYDSQQTRHSSACDRLDWFRGGLETAKSDRVSISRKLLKSRERQKYHERNFLTAADNFHLMKEELRKSKLTQNVLLRQMLQPKQEERPWSIKLLDI